MSNNISRTQQASSQIWGYGLLIAIGLIAPFVVYPTFLMKVLCFALFACAFNLLLGFAGLLSFGHAAFFGAAAYVCAWLSKALGLSPELSILAGGLVAANRKKFRGVLEITDTPQTWQITWRDEPPSKPGMRPARVKKDLPVQALQFTLSELRDARLAPIVNFKGRRPAENRSNES